MGLISAQNRTIFQALAKQIRYLPEQPNFSPDQRIWVALTTEYQWNFGGAENVPIRAPAEHSFTAACNGAAYLYRA
jgi:hypothetical protein